MTSASAGSASAMIKLNDTDRTIVDPEQDIRGRTVVDEHDEELGKVADLLVDSEAEAVRFIVVEHGGILGIGATETFLPVESITEITDDRVFVNTDRKTVAGAPEYDPELGDQAGFYEDVYGYYGIPPFWTPGYVAPTSALFGRRPL